MHFIDVDKIPTLVVPIIIGVLFTMRIGEPESLPNLKTNYTPHEFHTKTHPKLLKIRVSFRYNTNSFRGERE